MNTLKDLAKKFGTDKYSHRFCDFYEQQISHLRQEKIKLLEIGILKGRSLKMWKEYFPHGLIYGADVIDKSHLMEDRISIEKCDQENQEDLKHLFNGETFDIIIDDGGHTMKQQQFTLANLFCRIKPGGVFFMEDLHTSYSHTTKFNNENYKTTAELLFTMYDVLSTQRETHKVKNEGFAITSSQIGSLRSLIDTFNIFFSGPQSCTCSIKRIS